MFNRIIVCLLLTGVLATLACGGMSNSAAEPLSESEAIEKAREWQISQKADSPECNIGSTGAYRDCMKRSRDVDRKNKDIAKLLKINYWATIVVYKNNNELAREIGIYNKEDIYNLIKKGI